MIYNVTYVMQNVHHPGKVFWELPPFNREIVHQPEGLLSIWLGDIMVLQMQHESIECAHDGFIMHAGLQQCMGGSALIAFVEHSARQKAQARQQLHSNLGMQHMASIQATGHDLSGCLSERSVGSGTEALPW